MTYKADEIRRTFGELGKTVAEAIEEYEAKLATANALVTCCCGNAVDSHGMGDGHSPVDQYHYSYMKLTERVAELEKRLQIGPSGEDNIDQAEAAIDHMQHRIETLEAALKDALQEAVIAWSVCASIHREYGQGHDALFSTRQNDFANREIKARAALGAT